MAYVPSFDRVRSRRSPLPVVVVLATFLALLGGFMFDTALRGQAASSPPVELRT